MGETDDVDIRAAYQRRHDWAGAICLHSFVEAFRASHPSNCSKNCNTFILQTRDIVNANVLISGHVVLFEMPGQLPTTEVHPHHDFLLRAPDRAQHHDCGFIQLRFRDKMQVPTKFR